MELISMDPSIVYNDETHQSGPKTHFCTRIELISKDLRTSPNGTHQHGPKGPSFVYKNTINQ